VYGNGFHLWVIYCACDGIESTGIDCVYTIEASLAGLSLFDERLCAVGEKYLLRVCDGRVTTSHGSRLTCDMHRLLLAYPSVSPAVCTIYDLSQGTCCISK
jgi:hypothetical protein